MKNKEIIFGLVVCWNVYQKENLFNHSRSFAIQVKNDCCEILNSMARERQREKRWRWRWSKEPSGIWWSRSCAYACALCVSKITWLRHCLMVWKLSSAWMTNPKQDRAFCCGCVRGRIVLGHPFSFFLLDSVVFYPCHFCFILFLSDYMMSFPSLFSPFSFWFRLFRSNLFFLSSFPSSLSSFLPIFLFPYNKGNYFLPSLFFFIFLSECWMMSSAFSSSTQLLLPRRMELLLRSSCLFLLRPLLPSHLPLIVSIIIIIILSSLFSNFFFAAFFLHYFIFLCLPSPSQSLPIGSSSAFLRIIRSIPSSELVNCSDIVTFLRRFVVSLFFFL